MVRALEQAIGQISRRDADQEQIGGKPFSHVEKLKALRIETDKGTQLLDEGKGRALDMEDFLRNKNSRCGGA